MTWSEHSDRQKRCPEIKEFIEWYMVLFKNSIPRGPYLDPWKKLHKVGGKNIFREAKERPLA